MHYATRHAHVLGSQKQPAATSQARDCMTTFQTSEYLRQPSVQLCIRTGHEQAMGCRVDRLQLCLDCVSKGGVECAELGKRKGSEERACDDAGCEGRRGRREVCEVVHDEAVERRDREGRVEGAQEDGIRHRRPRQTSVTFGGRRIISALHNHGGRCL